MRKGKKILLIGICLLVFIGGIVALFRYLAYREIITKEVAWEWTKTWGIIGSIAILLLIFVIWMINKIIERKSLQGVELPREIVDSDDAIAVWKNAFIKGSRMFHYITFTDNKPSLKLANEKDLSIQNEWSFFDDVTGQKFIKFEAVSRDGQRKGINTVIIRTDLGKEDIEKNWNAMIKQNTPLSMLKLEKKFPIASSADDNVRMAIFKYKMGEEGFDENELKYLEAFKTQNPQKTPKKEGEEETEEEKEAKVLDNAVKIEQLKKSKGG